MKNAGSSEHKYDIRAGLPIISMKYGFSMDEEDYLEYSVDALKDINHFGLIPMVSYVEVDKDGFVPIPCNMTVLDGVGTVEHIITAFPDRIVEKERKIDSDWYVKARELRKFLAWPEYRIRHQDSFLTYMLRADKIEVMDREYRGEEIGIAYTGYMVDDEGFPLITRKQANALAAIAARNIVMRAALQGDRNKAAMLELVTRDATRLKQAASIPEELTDNELDEMMDAQNTFNRKSFGRPQKYSR